jgi:hypothetical protein
MKLTPYTRRAIYTLDAAGSLALGAALAAFPAVLSPGEAVGAGLVRAVGLGLIAWAVFNFWIGSRDRLPHGAAALNILGDGAWVAVSIGLLTLAGPGLSSIGALAVGVMATGVAAIGLVKFAGLRRPPEMA